MNIIPKAEILTRDEARGLGSRLKDRGLLTVFTNGCFDIIHPGHVHLLRQARAMGDCLIVGVNSDDSVTRLKGSGRPVNGIDYRMTVLSEFRSVDYVVPFGEDTPLELIREIVPDILVKGDDYTVEEVAGGDFVIAAGGCVRTVPLLEGYSTSKVVEGLKG